MEVLGGGPADRDDFCLWMQGVCDPLNIHTHTSTHTPTNPLQHNLGGRRNAGIAQGGSKGAQLSLALSARHQPKVPRTPFVVSTASLGYTPDKVMFSQPTRKPNAAASQGRSNSPSGYFTPPHQVAPRRPIPTSVLQVEEELFASNLSPVQQYVSGGTGLQYVSLVPDECGDFFCTIAVRILFVTISRSWWKRGGWINRLSKRSTFSV